MNVTVAQYVRGVLDVRGDIEGIRVVASSLAFQDTQLRDVFGRRISGITPPENEGIAYLGSTARGLLFCRFEPYNGAGGRYTQVRAMHVCGAQHGTFRLRDLLDRLPEKRFYAEVEDLAEMSFDLPEGAPRWGTDAIGEDNAGPACILLTDLLSGRKIIAETGAASGDTQALLFDAWSLLPPSFRNSVTFTSCREASGRPEALQVQLVESRRTGGAGTFWSPSGAVSPVASGISNELIDLLRGDADFVAVHHDVECDVGPLPRDASAEKRLQTAASAVAEWTAWSSLQRAEFPETDLRSYLQGMPDRRVSRVAEAIARRPPAQVRTIVSGLTPETMYGIGQAVARHPDFSEKLVDKLETALLGEDIDALPLWRGIVAQYATAPSRTAFSIESLWRLFRPSAPTSSARNLFSKFDHNCDDRLDDSDGWWAWIDEQSWEGLAQSSFRSHVLKCRHSHLRWAYFLASADFSKMEEKSLTNEATKSPGPIAEFVETWLDRGAGIDGARLEKLRNLLLCVFRNAKASHPQLARQVQRLSALQPAERNRVRTVLEEAGDRGAVAELQLGEAMAQMLESLKVVDATRAQKGDAVAARAIPRDTALLVYLSLLAMSRAEIQAPMLEVLASLQKEIEPFDAKAVERLKLRMRFGSAEQALAYAFLTEWLTRRPGAAAEILVDDGLRNERERMAQLLTEVAEGLLAEDPSSPSSGKGRSLLSWFFGDRADAK